FFQESTPVLEDAVLFSRLREGFKKFFLLFGQLRRGVDNDSDDLCTPGATLQVGNAVTGEFEVRAGLRAGRYFHAHLAVNRLDCDSCAERGLNHADMLLAED